MSASIARRSVTEQLLLGALREHDGAEAARAESSRASYLARISRRLAATLDETEVRDVIRRLTLPGRDAWCLLEVVDMDGSHLRIGGLHADPVKQSLLSSLDHRWASGGAAPRPPGRAGDYEIISHTARPELERAMRDAASLAILDTIGFGALLVVPLVTRARPQGTLIFVSGEREAPFSKEEIGLAGEIAIICGMGLDNARMYAEADSLRRAADAANHAKSAFLATMSHELRTPLNAIGGFVELVDLAVYGPVTPEQHKALARVSANQRELLRVITEILDFARIEGGHMDCRREPVAIAQVVDEVASMLAGAAAGRGMAIVADGLGAEASAWGDPDRIRQVLINLVMNAIKYSPQDAGPITITTVVRDGMVELRVKDQGPGIPPHMLEPIFQPFIQLNDRLADRRGGVGLGLAISRELATAMQGTLTVESVVGHGSTFTLTLALAPEKDAATAG
jgi:signal transduction histidine kinase